MQHVSVHQPSNFHGIGSCIATIDFTCAVSGYFHLDIWTKLIFSVCLVKNMQFYDFSHFQPKNWYFSCALSKTCSFTKFQNWPTKTQRRISQTRPINLIGPLSAFQHILNTQTKKKIERDPPYKTLSKFSKKQGKGDPLHKIFKKKF